MTLTWWFLPIALALPGVASAQILPSLPSLPATGGVVGPVTGLTNNLPLVGDVRQAAQRLAEDRVSRLTRLARRNPETIALDRDGNPVRAGEVVIADADDATIAAAQGDGFALIERTTLDELGIGFARLRAPKGLSIERAIQRARKFAGGHDVSADPLHFASGASGEADRASPSGPASVEAGTRIGVVDGGIDSGSISGAVTQSGFAAGAPATNNHGTAIASLIRGGSGIRGAAPGAALFVADVYGRDPAGGSATTIARALAWMVAQRVPVVTISLVGPANPLLERAVAAAQARGTILVAAVGNDGPAAPPAYPASYPGVIAVTGVDGRNRALIEAGRASHLDYAAPAADMLAANAGARPVAVRGTSFAAPLVAARLSHFYPAPDSTRLGSALNALNGEAHDLGPRGPDRTFGRGLVCETCRTTKK